MMKLSKETLQLLKNYASINPNLLIKEGNKLSTMNIGQTIISEAVVTETFESTFGIYYLNEFLATMSLFDDPDLEFRGDVAYIKNGNTSIKYVSSEPELLTVPQKEVKFPVANVELNLTAG